MKRNTSILFISLLCYALLTTGAWAADSAGEPGRVEAKANPLKNVYFGEQHIHTSASPDGGYMLDLKSPSPDGQIKAAYFNPK
jgi:hypothetical protein